MLFIQATAFTSDTLLGILLYGIYRKKIANAARCVCRDAKYQNTNYTKYSLTQTQHTHDDNAHEATLSDGDEKSV